MVVSNQISPALSPVDHWLWECTAPQAMLNALETARSSSNAAASQQLTFWTVIRSRSDVDVARELKRVVPPGVAEFRALGTATFARIAVDATAPFVVSSWPLDNGVVRLVATVPASDSRWKKFERWILNASPALSPCYLNEDDFLAIGESLAEFGDVEVSKMSWREGSRSHSIGYRDDRPALTTAVNRDVPATGQVRSAMLRAGELTIHVRRLAGATFYHGALSAFDHSVLRRLERATRDRLELLTGRVRTLVNTPPALSILLAVECLKTPEDTGEVIEILSHESRMGVAVIHRNPYLHVAVTDYVDGSNFDVFVTKPDEVNVHSGFTASVGAMNRLLQRLSEHLPARSIVERSTDFQVSATEILS